MCFSFRFFSRCALCGEGEWGRADPATAGCDEGEDRGGAGPCQGVFAPILLFPHFPTIDTIPFRAAILHPDPRSRRDSPPETPVVPDCLPVDSTVRETYAFLRSASAESAENHARCNRQESAGCRGASGRSVNLTPRPSQTARETPPASLRSAAPSGRGPASPRTTAARRGRRARRARRRRARRGRGRRGRGRAGRRARRRRGRREAAPAHHRAAGGRERNPASM